MSLVLCQAVNLGRWQQSHHLRWHHLCCATTAPAIPRHGSGRAVTPGAALAVLHSGEYFLFESDSEEEEEAAAVPEETRPSRHSAFEVSMADGMGPAVPMGCQQYPWGADSPSAPASLCTRPG